MSHDIHEGPDGAILYDGCDECSARANDPLSGLLALDHDNFARLHKRVLDVEDHGGTYLTVNEAKIGQALGRLLILIERHPQVFP